MPNKYFTEILNTNIEIFKNNFCNKSKELFKTENSKSYIHNGEFGMYREALVREFIRYFTPGKFSISEGFVINHRQNESGRSTQCDVILFDKSATPLVQDPALQRFYPIETVAAVGEVKSVLTETTLKKALNRLANTKRMRDILKDPSLIYRTEHLRSNVENSQQRIEECVYFHNKVVQREVNPSDLNKFKLNLAQDKIITNIKNYIKEHSIQEKLIDNLDKYFYHKENKRNNEFNLNTNHEDNILTFLICEKINFNKNTNNKAKAVIDKYPSKLKKEFRHNMILSLEDGLFLYQDEFSQSKKYSQYPKKKNKEFKHVFIPSDSQNTHIKIFSNYLFMALSDVTILYPEITHYLEHTVWNPNTEIE
ncbi:hypothetical protein L2D08_14220 [Domibacillus sp. PGB-M46]|uniref:DUF6602 domain-containing protein n=1 Tax=Domibacillus sp. PGB-M46 TaxID=2910255 RepID=UPI001F592941|nr:DUF6602 domain-containing protein [Domibacillus sp. PGB-M46]MCI2255526.1 hypothetical protein [Domibacillus sp. PGB-M46]